MSNIYLTYLNKGIAFLAWVECIGVILVLIIASVLQFYLAELPCPLCLLQRAAMMLMVIPILLNLRYKRHIFNYTLSSLAALLLGGIAMRQVLLHINDPQGSGYGNTLLGFHLYTWVSIMAVIVIAYNCIVSSALREYKAPSLYYQNQLGKRVVSITILLFIVTALLNVITTYSECGLQQCPDNPTHYIHEL
ncbi:disulfide bond formation protein B [Shewanella surugensis]|uniref:Disulfide bond formation protein B n=1 Tax=Shewanella surugensis TaxID=212020 RepID=A0ABT0LE24_9GAMM|nr:disulfide bond formation protein B [Shewanella surugensis]MCL1125959.1 disulfide bond formation protein B [Shewanella surugensis]